MSWDGQLCEFVGQQIEKLRPKLLDFSRHNPLVATRLTERSASTVRVVDEIPTEVFQRLVSGSMRLIPLPPLEDDPKDEDTEEFQTALAEARLTDQVYIEQVEQIDETSDADAAEQLINIERELKDRLRETLGLPPRPTKVSFSLQQHARINGINPSYDLPHSDEIAENGQHTDDLIQTLLLPDIFQRRLDAIRTKCRTFLQETGIDVLNVTFGFLEWAGTENEKPSFAPLVLMPAKLEKKRTPSGPEFWISGDETVESNVVLTEKFRLEFAIEFPQYEPGTPIEEYFEAITNAAPPGRRWRVRRQVAVGVFPSARMAMYHDLAPGNWDFGAHEVIRTLFGGSTGNSGAPVYGDDYDVDMPQVEAKVPLLVTEADSSQFSTIADVMDGNSLAVEGPPGTGKSQTIINTIAAALADGKHVLFVAEKAAALDVVRSRLEALGLGEFVLPLIATRSGRDAVIESIRKRVEMSAPADPSQLDEKIEKFREVRAVIGRYVDVIGTPFGETGLTVFDVLGRQIGSREELANWPDELRRHVWPNLARMTDTRLDEICQIAADFDQAERSCEQHAEHWRGIGVRDLNPYRTSEILEAAQQCANAFAHSTSVRTGLEAFGLSAESDEDRLAALQDQLRLVAEDIKIEMAELASRLMPAGALEDVEDFLRHAETARALKTELEGHCAVPLAADLVPRLEKITSLMARIGISEFSVARLVAIVEEREENLRQAETLAGFLDQANEITAEAITVLPAHLLEACRLLEGMSVEALALRSERLENPLAWDFLENIQCKAANLKSTREALEQVVSLDSVPNHADVGRHAGALSSAGFFGFLSPAVRDAKRVYRTITRRPKFEKETAVADLRDLASWLKGVSEIEGDRNLEGLLGLKFDGIDTDFAAVGLLVQFYRRLDDVLPGAAGRSMRSFLRHGELEAIKSLPKSHSVELGPFDGLTWEDIRVRLEELRASKANLKRDLADLQAVIPALNCPEGISRKVIAELVAKARTLQSQWPNLERNDRVKTLLGDAFFRGADTSAAEARAGIDIAKRARELGDATGTAFVLALSRGRRGNLDELLGRIREADDGACAALDEVSRHVEVSPDVLRGTRDRHAIITWLQAAAADRDGLQLNSRLASRRARLKDEGYGFVLVSLDANQRDSKGLADGLRALITDAMAREVYREHGQVLAAYNGASMDALRAKLTQFDREILSLSRQRLRAKLKRDTHPPLGNGAGPKRTWTELSLIRNEVNKQRRHISPRDLTNRAGRALLQLKPCWMMSPLSVAQYIEKGSIHFDLLIIDEASQMTPENAVGALLRSQQAMVVGDTNQLPPTSFFQKIVASDDEEEDEDAVTDESILERANAAFRPTRRLRWHYRSRHSGLIRFSNHEIYDNDLIVFPSATEDDSSMGAHLVEIDGSYASGTNPAEATAMVSAIAKFMMTDRDRSLGVVTVNQKQRDLLLEEFEYALAHDPALAAYVDEWETRNDGLESFFIKNLENVQGDERDVIFIGTVYGPAAPGERVMQRFGPISGMAGRRRLNVLFSRAKQQVKTFSSMRPTDIQADEGGNPGAYMLKRWLEYSKTGVLHAGKDNGGEPDSPFEEFVIQQIKAMGCEPVPQVGVAGYFIDIGIRHPAWPYGFLMGVECDGATYHSAKSARDRDRLRQEVLEGLGWHLHRIWSTDWFEHPTRQAEHLRQAIEARLKDLQGSDFGAAEETPYDRVDMTAQVEFDLPGINVADATVHDDAPLGTREMIGLDEAERRLIALREEEVLDEFPESDRDKGLLRRSMIKALLENLPEDEGAFRASIPLRLRERTDPRQMKYLEPVLEILSMVRA